MAPVSGDLLPTEAREEEDDHVMVFIRQVVEMMMEPSLMDHRGTPDAPVALVDTPLHFAAPDPATPKSAGIMIRKPPQLSNEHDAIVLQKELFQMAMEDAGGDGQPESTCERLRRRTSGKAGPIREALAQCAQNLKVAVRGEDVRARRAMSQYIREVEEALNLRANREMIPEAAPARALGLWSTFAAGAVADAEGSGASITAAKNAGVAPFMRAIRRDSELRMAPVVAQAANRIGEAAQTRSGADGESNMAPRAAQRQRAELAVEKKMQQHTNLDRVSVAEIIGMRLRKGAGKAWEKNAEKPSYPDKDIEVACILMKPDGTRWKDTEVSQEGIEWVNLGEFTLAGGQRREFYKDAEDGTPGLLTVAHLAYQELPGFTRRPRNPRQSGPGSASITC